MNDPYDLRRFVDAQHPVYPRVRAELRSGRKTSHWMWFIFPQISGLGSSPLARKFAISSLEEAARLSGASGPRPAPRRMHRAGQSRRGPPDRTDFRLSR